MSFARLTIEKKTVSLVLTIVFFLGGIKAFLDMPRLEDPEFTIKEALVVTNYPGATPAEVADEVTDVIEGAAQQLKQLDKVTAISNRGQSIVTVEVQDKYDKNTLPQVWDELRRKVSDAQSFLPPGAGPSLVIDDFSDVYGILLSVTGDGYSQQDLQDYVTFLRKQLLLVENVAKITVWGEQQETVFVEISRARMAQLGVSLDSVYNTLSNRNLVVESGNVKVGREYIEIAPSGGVESVEDLGDLFIRDGSGKLVPLRDVAEIHRGYQSPPSQIMGFNGHNAIAIGISMNPSANVVELGQAINAKLDQLQAQTPVGINVEEVYFQPSRVDNAVNSFVINLAEAVAIVIIVLLLFMGMQSGLLIGAILLITICGSFIFIQMAGVALERISLGALIIALGMLVDNAIVVIEGVLIRYQKGMDRIQAAVDVVEQSKWPLLGGTIIAIMAFAGIGLSPDSVGEFCRSLFIVLFISLMMSWITAVTVTPLLCEMFLRPKISEEGDPYGGFIFRAYRRILEFCLRKRVLTMATLAVMLAGSIYGFGFVKQSFFPDSTQPRFYIHYWLPQGTDIRATAEDVQDLAEVILKDEQVKNVSTFTGQGAPRFILTYSPEKTAESYGLLLVEVKDYETTGEVMDRYKKYLYENYPQAEAKVKKFKLGPGRAASIEVRFSGPDTKVLRELSHEAQDIMLATGRAESVRDDWRQDVKVLSPVIMEAQAKRAGITRPDLAKAMQMFFSGTNIGVYREGDKLLPIVARPPDKERLDVNQIGDVQIFSPVAGRMIPVEEVVSGFKTNIEPGKLLTRNRMLTITASCEPVEGLPSVLFNELRPQIEGMKIPAGYTMEWGGEFEDASDAQGSLAASLGGPFLIMILATVMLFNNLRIPTIIWLTVPLSIIGVTCGLLLTGEPFGFMALLGFLSLSGMLIKNAIVLLDQINLELAEGKEPYRAVVDSALSRIRPVAMAAGTTILGMLPLVTDAFFSAMAVTIMAGLAFATVLTLLVVPVLYAMFYKVKNPA
ncbi:efflux RND transporter permease subunit [Maridesulfovibrio salexigens]|uniref:Acriflavin resistance protein n=1 Tax=Maridesulfovibrio salexigens (strain ATCC 14822 / DSM 2638 / NCIMB 8403 / VKM B-1763) TaxID=526222 RepID=C6BV05_MARSD|nr:efflux RND transporter permease subunit [Maridesulfovibrio salexigens]ACS78142.1 acriflavin resistance protein [Maridesulfovibrio salexigens DSM 2638]